MIDPADAKPGAEVLCVAIAALAEEIADAAAIAPEGGLTSHGSRAQSLILRGRDAATLAAALEILARRAAP